MLFVDLISACEMDGLYCLWLALQYEISETAEDSGAQLSQTRGGERRTADMVEERDTWLVRHDNRERRA